MLLAVIAAKGQKFVTTTYVENTSISPKAGIAVGAENNYGWEYGGFYQESKVLEDMLLSEQDIARLPHRYEQVFYGAYFSAPVLQVYHAVLKFNVRTGVANQASFVITPSLLADLKINKAVSIGGGIGVRAFAPTFQTNLSIRL